MSLPWWQCIAVAQNKTARAASRNEPSKNEPLKNEKNQFCPGQDAVHGYRCMDVYNIIACMRIIHTRACAII